MQHVQMVWADAYRVGCAVVNCPNLSDLYYYHYLYDPFTDDGTSDTAHPNTAYMMVCVYGPGYPSSIYNLPPYIRGAPCSQCSDQSSECEQSTYHNSPPQYAQQYLNAHQATGAGFEDPLLGGLCCKQLS
jgi:hypothetical protein